MKKAKKSSKKKAKKPAKKSSSRPVKNPKAKKLPKSELEIYKKLLLHLRGKIAGDLQKIEGDTLSSEQPVNTAELSDVADLATDNYDRELNIGLASNEQQLLNDIDMALKKIEDGTYGICEIYGTPIPKKRLLAMPYTRLSVRAQEEEEKNKRRP
ncbi:MAG TPA: TraR/DksA C4-type zinc finger protein [Candidatus Omnitrophota bacterium]|nr:TraR/DksA C4-type zinc finger protein [Candidatus Omnitrophota bacterium]HRY85208.1 TraR/DksA C4-type zinc finger protein [Candidatus Omnitrophota bacterium]